MTTVHTVKSYVKISQNFVAYSEYMNFKILSEIWEMVTSFFRGFTELRTVEDMEEGSKKLEKSGDVL